MLSRSAGIFTLFSRKTVAFARKRSRRRKKRASRVYSACCEVSLAATREISPATRQIPSNRNIASPSYGEVAARESVQTERSKGNNAPSVGNKLPTAPHSDGEPLRANFALLVRCCRNARSRLVILKLFWRAAQHDKGVKKRLFTSLISLPVRFLRSVRRAEGPPLFGRNDTLYFLCHFGQALEPHLSRVETVISTKVDECCEAAARRNLSCSASNTIYKILSSLQSAK